MTQMSRIQEEATVSAAANQPPEYTDVEAPLWETRISASEHSLEDEDEPPEYDQVANSLVVTPSSNIGDETTAVSTEEPPPYDIAIQNSQVVFSSL